MADMKDVQGAFSPMTTSVPFVAALCPTFRHPNLLANSLALWLAQDYPLESRRLFILDDDPTFHGQEGTGWKLYASDTRYPSLPAKYNTLVEFALAARDVDIFLIWEDDDTYLPGYIRSHVLALSVETAEFSKPSIVRSDYSGQPAPENGAGRFHASMAFRRDLIRRIGGWPETKRADFDQQLMRALETGARGVADPCDFMPPQYVYGWHTGHAHCQSTMRSPDDETWYDRGEQAYARVPFVGKLEPQYDERTRKIFGQLGLSI
jgi:hypothetical protein